jgi:hypothetical protein
MMITTTTIIIQTMQLPTKVYVQNRPHGTCAVEECVVDTVHENIRLFSMRRKRTLVNRYNAYHQYQ